MLWYYIIKGNGSVESFQQLVHQDGGGASLPCRILVQLKGVGCGAPLQKAQAFENSCASKICVV